MQCSQSLRRNIRKNVEAENADIRGKINAEGLINAEQIKIEFENDGSAENIGGGKIVIFPHTHSKPIARLPLISKIMGKAGADCFTVNDSIEGDEIALENVTAENVSGRVVAIGAGCRISCVKYGETIEISPDAEVGTYEKIYKQKVLSQCGGFCFEKSEISKKIY